MGAAAPDNAGEAIQSSRYRAGRMVTPVERVPGGLGWLEQRGRVRHRTGLITPAHPG